MCRGLSPAAAPVPAPGPLPAAGPPPPGSPRRLLTRRPGVRSCHRPPLAWSVCVTPRSAPASRPPPVGACAAAGSPAPPTPPRPLPRAEPPAPRSLGAPAGGGTRTWASAPASAGEKGRAAEEEDEDEDGGGRPGADQVRGAGGGAAFEWTRAPGGTRCGGRASGFRDPQGQCPAAGPSSGARWGAGPPSGGVCRQVGEGAGQGRPDGAEGRGVSVSETRRKEATEGPRFCGRWMGDRAAYN